MKTITFFVLLVFCLTSLASSPISGQWLSDVQGNLENANESRFEKWSIGANIVREIDLIDSFGTYYSEVTIYLIRNSQENVIALTKVQTIKTQWKAFEEPSYSPQPISSVIESSQVDLEIEFYQSGDQLSVETGNLIIHLHR